MWRQRIREFTMRKHSRIIANHVCKKGHKMRSGEKIYEALVLPFTYRRDDLKEKISRKVMSSVQELKRLELSEEELVALKSCYETEYQDSIGSLQVIVSLAGLVAGISIVDNLPLPELIGIFIKILLFVVWCVIFYFQINKIAEDNASLRNYIMAATILLEENKEK